MASRAADYYFGIAFLWGVIAVLRLASYNFRYPLPLFVAAGLVVSGVGFGVGVGSEVARREIASIERSGEFRASTGIVLVGIGAVFVLGAFLFLFAQQIPYSAFTAIFDFLSPSVPAIFASEAFLFRHWERKRKKSINLSLWSGKIYVNS
jgi:hypothetical protein